MSELSWEVVKLLRGRRRTGQPFASIGYGRISLNREACELVDLNTNGYKYVEILKGYNGRRFEKMALKFTKEETKVTCKITRRVRKETEQPGCDINSKVLIKELFGENGINQLIKYPVVLDSTNKDTIIIDIMKPLS